MIIEIAVICCVVLILCVLAQRSLYTKKLDYLRDVLSDKEADIVSLTIERDRAKEHLKCRNLQYEVLGDQIAAIKEVLEDA